MSYLKSFLAALIYVMMQALAGFFMPIFARLSSGNVDGTLQNLFSPSTMSPSMLGLSLIISGILGCLVLWKLKFVRLPEAFDGSHDRLRPALLAVVAALVGIFAALLMCEQLNLPDLIAAQMEEMADTVWGILAMTLIGPIAEELVFREGVSRLRGRRNQIGTSTNAAYYVERRR